VYIEYWKLYKKPFENVTDPAFFYASREHEEALSRMRYVVSERKPGLLLLGSYGVGKTYLSRTLIVQSPPEQYKFIYIANPRLNPLELLREICFQLGCPCEKDCFDNKVDALHEIESALKANHGKGIHNVLIFDEAQSITVSSLLEEVRLLLNIQTDTAILFTLLFLGQPTIMKDMETMPQFLQRLGVRYCLGAFSQEETKGYIQHRLKVAGLNQDIFTDAAFVQIHSFSGGVARAINNICDMALLAGFMKKMSLIDENVICQVSKDLKHGLRETQRTEKATNDRILGGIQGKRKRQSRQ